MLPPSLGCWHHDLNFAVWDLYTNVTHFLILYQYSVIITGLWNYDLGHANTINSVKSDCTFHVLSNNDNSVMIWTYYNDRQTDFLHNILKIKSFGALENLRGPLSMSYVTAKFPGKERYLLQETEGIYQLGSSEIGWWKYFF